MMQTKAGAQKAKEKHLAQDPNYYANIGSKGGKAYHTEPTGYASNKVGKDGLTGRERARQLGDQRRKHA